MMTDSSAIQTAAFQCSSMSRRGNCHDNAMAESRVLTNSEQPRQIPCQSHTDGEWRSLSPHSVASKETALLLLDIFEKDLLRLPQFSDEQMPPVCFESSTLPIVPAEMRAPGISVEKRQVYRGGGLMDSVRIVLDRAHSTALGLWILAAALQKRHASYCLHLSSCEQGLRKIIWRVESRSAPGLNIREADFVWVPGALSNDLSSGLQHLYLSQTARLSVVNGDGDWDAPLDTRHALQGRGGPGAACMLAAFFLDFGLSSNELNFDYIKDDGASQLVDAHSCEARVELLDAWNHGVMTRGLNSH